MGEAFEECLQADVQFHAGKRRAEADVDTGTEANVITGIGTGGVEFVGTFEDGRIVVGSGDEKEDSRAFPHGVPFDLKCFGGHPEADLSDGVLAQRLLDRVGPAFGMCQEVGQLIGVTDKCHDCVTECMGGGDEPGTQERPRKHSDLDVGEIAVVEDGRQDAVVGAATTEPLNMRGEIVFELAQRRHGGLEVPPGRGRGGEQFGAGFGVCVEAGYLVMRNAQHLGDDFDGDSRSVVGHQITGSLVPEIVKQGAGNLLDAVVTEEIGGRDDGPTAAVDSR